VYVPMDELFSSHVVPLLSTFVHSSVCPQPSVVGGGLFVRLISHQPAVLFSQNEPATSNQPEPGSSTLLSEQTSTSHQPPADRPNRRYRGRSACTPGPPQPANLRWPSCATNELRGCARPLPCSRVG
jgi:hypothetical protein